MKPRSWWVLIALPLLLAAFWLVLNVGQVANLSYCCLFSSPGRQTVQADDQVETVVLGRPDDEIGILPVPLLAGRLDLEPGEDLNHSVESALGGQAQHLVVGPQGVDCGNGRVGQVGNLSYI